jgi:hypothetical protein
MNWQEIALMGGVFILGCTLLGVVVHVAFWLIFLF